ncbi:MULTISPECIES: S8 family peptidase [unclassified Burkholderia]|uniref:S8 family peptidase n=1 Tax=unclassified Burkholderia TaxID=2613784 RepID=UPI00214F88F4|nr:MULTISPECIES: S8 family serine peptidase [unclassified Burkholderia]MCR4469782.1 S8 family serine peptidase [Burkholderia sp. SCN-KJ]
MKPMQRRHFNELASSAPVRHCSDRSKARVVGAGRLVRWLAHRLLLGAALVMSGCALVPATPDPVAATQQMKANPERMIVLAVRNPPETLMLRAGTTAGGYGAPGGYSAGGSARAQVAALAKQYGLREVSAWPIPSLKVHCAMLEIADGARRSEVLARLAVDPRVRLAQPLQTFDLLGDAPHGNGYADLQQGFREISADAAQKVSRGDSVRVAVIDTGVDTTHPDLHGRIVATRNFVDQDWTQFNRDLHGTAVAGVIAADRAATADDKPGGIEGVAPHAKLIAVKACWQRDNHTGHSVCNSFTLAEAVQAALEAHAQIINMSLGGPADPLLKELIELSVKKGVIVVGAVLPDGDLKAFPVGVPGVIAVDSARATGSAPSVAGSNVLYAPGRDILTLTPGGHYDFVSGSSYATANVTGTIALLLGLQPNLDAHSIQTLLDQTSGPSRQHARVINACRAITALHHPCADRAF